MAVSVSGCSRMVDSLTSPSMDSAITGREPSGVWSPANSQTTGSLARRPERIRKVNTLSGSAKWTSSKATSRGPLTARLSSRPASRSTSHSWRSCSCPSSSKCSCGRRGTLPERRRSTASPWGWHGVRAGAQPDRESAVLSVRRYGVQKGGLADSAVTQDRDSGCGSLRDHLVKESARLVKGHVPPAERHSANSFDDHVVHYNQPA